MGLVNIEDGGGYACTADFHNWIHVKFFSRDSRLYAIGGMKENGNPSDAFHVLDMESNRWMSEPPLHSSRYATTAFLLDDSIYSMGGRVGKLPSVACEVMPLSGLKFLTLTSHNQFLLPVFY